MENEQTGGSVDEGPASKHTQGQYNPRPYLVALEQLERNALRNLTICRVAVAVILLLLAPWVALQILEKADPFNLYFFGFIFLMVTIPAFFPGWSMGMHAAKLKEQFPQSGLAERIALGELEKHDPIFGHTPWLLRWLVPKNSSGKPMVTLGRVAGSLQWYLASPRLHIKQTWMMALGFLPFLFIIGMNSMMMSRVAGPALGNPIALLVLFIPGGLVGLVSYNYIMVRMLAEYLHGAWDQHLPETQVTSDEVERKAKLQLMLNQVQQDLEKVLAVQHMPILMSLMLGMFPFLISTVFGSGIFPIVCFGLFVASLVLFIQYWLPRYGFTAYRENLRSELENSRIALLIASGELDSLELIEHTPWVFRFIHSTKRMPKGFADNLRVQIWRASLNLDWFMEHPRTLVRPSWITNIALMFVALCSMVYAIMAPFRIMGSLAVTNASPNAYPTVPEMLAVGNITWLFLAAAIALAVPGIIHATKTRIWTEELIRHLRARLAG